MSIGVFEAARPVFKGLIIAVMAIAGAYLGHWAHGEMLNEHTPVQPIEFSHKVHAGDNEIPCQYCHSWADRSATAGVPSVETCVGCHKGLAEVRDKPEVVKLFDYWDSGRGHSLGQGARHARFRPFPAQAAYPRRRGMPDLPRSGGRNGTRNAGREPQ